MSLLMTCALKGVLPALVAFQPASYVLASKLAAVTSSAARAYSVGSLTDGKPKTVLAVLYSVNTCIAALLGCPRWMHAASVRFGTTPARPPPRT